MTANPPADRAQPEGDTHLDWSVFAAVEDRWRERWRAEGLQWREQREAVSELLRHEVHIDPDQTPTLVTWRHPVHCQCPNPYPEMDAHGHTYSA